MFIRNPLNGTRDLFRGKNDLIGLDIGSHCVKAAEVKENSDSGLFLKNFAIYPLPPETFVDGALMNSGAVVDVLVRMWSDLRLKNRNVAIALSGTSVITRHHTFPSQTYEELRDSIKDELPVLIPFDINDVNWDFHFVGEEQPPDHIGVFLVATKKELLNDYESVVREAGLTVCAVDIDVFCLQNLFERVNPEGFEGRDGAIENNVFINVGASKINFSLVAGQGRPQFTRDISVAGNHITDEIMKVYNESEKLKVVSFDEAERLKMGGEDGEELPVDAEIEKTIKKALEDIVIEIERSVKFQPTIILEQHNTRLHLTGGTSCVPMLKDMLAERLGYAVETLNPFKGVEFDSKKFNKDDLERFAPYAGVAMGLALRKKGDREK